MYWHYTAVRSVSRKLRAIKGFSHKGESVKRGSTVYWFPNMSFAALFQVEYSSYNSLVWHTRVFYLD